MPWNENQSSSGYAPNAFMGMDFSNYTPGDYSALAQPKPSLLPDVSVAPKNTFSNWLWGGKGSDGTRTPAGFSTLFDVAKTGLNAYGGFKQLGLAEDSLNFQKDAFSKQFANQSKLVNSQLRDRQQARLDRNPNNVSVDDYMKQYGV